jgi:Xaa-Pro aminopeptidase
MQNKIYKERQRAARRKLKQIALDGFVIESGSNLSYLTGFSGDDSWALITANRVYLLTDSRYIEQAGKECDCVIEQRKGRMTELLVEILGRTKSIRKIGIEKTVSVEMLQAVRKKLRKRKIKVKPVAGITESLRLIKSKKEINSIKRAGQTAAKVLQKAAKKLKPGITENEWAGIVEFEMRRLGVIRSFETIVAFGKNASIVHYRPAMTKLKKNDNVLIDFGVRYNGYCCDISRSFSVGKPSRKYRKALESVKKAQLKAIDKIKEGVKAYEIDKIAKNSIRADGFPPHGHGTGHGLGLNVHERPIVSIRSRDVLKAGMVITIEPGAYLPGKFGIRVEDDILVTKTGCEVLTKSCPNSNISQKKDL